MQRCHYYRTIILLLYCLPAVIIFAQEKKSKVFKSKPASFRVIEMRESEVTYQLWEGFQLMRNANAGDAASQHELSLRYLTGKGFPYDTVKSALWMKKAADQNFIVAKFNYGIFLNNGWGVDWNPFDAYKYFKDAAVNGMREGQYVLGLLYMDNLVVQRNYTAAYDWIKKSFDQKYEPAKAVLLELEKRGIQGSDSARISSAEASGGTAVRSSPSTPDFQPVLIEFDDDKTAATDDLTLLKELFNEGSEELRVVLGISKILVDTLQHDSTGFSIIQQSADLGNPEALTIIARCYDRGIGVKKDKLLAAVNYIRAIRLDSRRAPALLWRLINEKNVMAEITTSASRNSPSALYVLSSVNALGMSSSLTEEQSLQFLQMSASHSFIPALLDLGSVYSKGQWVKSDKKKAAEFWQHAAALGSMEGKIRIAVTELFEGTITDARRSLKELEGYSDEGSVLAQTALGYCYEKGILVPINLSQAIMYYRKAAQRGNQSAMTALTRLYNERRPKAKEFLIKEEM